MTSQINFQSIDAEYPVAGVDNDTQGFRDNFSAIKTALGTAQTEITQLQSNTAKLDTANDFKGTDLISPNLSKATSEFYPIGGVTGDIEISFSNGHYQTVVINSNAIVSAPGENKNITITLRDWPNTEDGNKYASMRVQLSVIPISETSIVTEVDWVINGGGTILADQSWPTPFTLDTDRNAILAEDSTVDNGGPVIVEFWTYNGGNTVYAKYLGTFSSVV